MARTMVAGGSAGGGGVQSSLYHPPTPKSPSSSMSLLKFEVDYEWMSETGRNKQMA